MNRKRAKLELDRMQETDMELRKNAMREIPKLEEKIKLLKKQIDEGDNSESTKKKLDETEEELKANQTIAYEND